MQSLNPIHRAFFSYAHEDAEFVLRLAKDLRAAGASVWMDRLDIKPGERWDREVEDALKKCPELLVILSPAAVESTNVMDEVSLALEEGKTILPVIHRNCEIPFRLRRFEYVDLAVDLTRNYEAGLDRLLETLGVAKPSSEIPKHAVEQDLDRDGGAEDVTLRELGRGQKLFSRFTLIKILGRGGMGIVWLARDDELERDVALKFLPEIIVHDRTLLGDLKREARRSLELTHKNIVRIYDFVNNQRLACISMEYVDGDTLSNLRADKPRRVFEPDELTDWTSQLCDALDYAHNCARIVHRDLKPANLMVNQRGDLKVSDFGIAHSLNDSVSKITRQRGKIGTLVYMSPQQLDGERGDHLADIYSFGASIYELLTSKPPFYLGNIDRQIREKVPPLMTLRRQELEIDSAPIDAAWEEVVRACLAKDPARRPQSTVEIAHRLELPSPKTPRPKQATRKPKHKASLAAVALIGGVAMVAAWYFGIQRPAERRSLHTAAQRQMQAESKERYAPGVGEVRITTSPSGATVTLGGLGTKKTPATFNANTGRYSLFVELDGYEPIAREVEAKEGQLIDLGTVTLQRGKSKIDLSSTPRGAKIFQGDTSLGVTPFRRDDFPSGQTTFRLILEGYLPREFTAQLNSKELFKATILLAKPLAVYKGKIGESVPITIKLGADLKSGAMAQSSTRGETVVKFAGVWTGATLRAVTHEVLSKPKGILWEGESFTLRFSDDGKTAAYECNYGTEVFTASLAAP